MSKKPRPVHPGEVYLEEFLLPLGLSQTRLALGIGAPSSRINEIVLGKRGVTAEMALRLPCYFDMLPHCWPGLQVDYDLDTAADRLAGRLAREVKPHSLAA